MQQNNGATDQMKILAITSGGGHWEQMMLLRTTFEGAEVTYVNTIDGLAQRAGVSPAYVVPDCNRNKPMANITCALKVLAIVAQTRPNIVISTGAAPGLIGLAIGKVFGAKAVWIDSIANSEQLSMSGKLAGRFADLWLTQWQHLSSPKGPSYLGSVL